MPDDRYIDPREEDIVYGDRRISRPDVSLPDWEVPDTAYRPIPIVWFTGAFLLHLIIAGILVIILSSQASWVPITLSAAAAGGIARWTWQRGMASAGLGWKVATITALGVNMFLAIAAATIGGE